MIFISILSFLLLVAAVILILNLSPERITEDLKQIISPKKSLHDKIKIAQGKKKSRHISDMFIHINEALIATGKGSMFSTICVLSLILMLSGAVVSIIIDNIFLLPILTIAFALIPFIYAKTTISYYDKHIKEEMETALSIITTSYIRNDDIVSAVSENILYLKPPVLNIFKSFLGEVVSINSNIKYSIRRLKNKINNDIFHEWCDTLIQCQDDSTLKDTLLTIVTKLTDVRIVNNELITILYEPRKEYYMMVAMVIGNIPLLYVLNKDWYYTLINTTVGKFILALSCAVIFITAILMMKYTKPIEYRR